MIYLLEFTLDSSLSKPPSVLIARNRFNSSVTESIGMYIFKLLSLYFLKSEIPARAFSSFQQKRIQTILEQIFCTEVKYFTVWFFPRLPDKYQCSKQRETTAMKMSKSYYFTLNFEKSMMINCFNRNKMSDFFRLKSNRSIVMSCRPS